MLSIKNNVRNELIIKKSRFITFLFRVDDVLSVDSYLRNLRCEFGDATHICYAYIIDGVKRFSDDGEPSGTAGMPILGVLENNNLDHILCFVVRYFGGIKLGANGLVRAYSNSCSEAIRCSSFVNLVSGKLCSVRFSYDDTKLVDSILQNVIIVDRVYDEAVTYFFKVSSADLVIFDELGKLFDFKILDDCLIEC